MYTIISTLLLFLIVVFSILLIFKSKKDRQDSLENGTCPSCKSTYRTFKDNNTNTSFKVEVIKKRLLKNHGCSGVTEFEYSCNSCGLKEVHNSLAQGCGI